MPTHRKTRPDSRLHRLTQAQKDAAFEYCQTASVRDGVRWLKEKFKVSTNRTSLGAWLEKQRIERSMAAELAELRDAHQGAFLIKEIADSSAPLLSANTILFANVLFKELRKPPAERDEDRFLRYLELVLKSRNLDIRDRAVQLRFERLRHLSSKKSSECPEELDPVEERKRTEKAMVMLFGEEPLGFVSESGLPVCETERGLRERGEWHQP